MNLMNSVDYFIILLLFYQSVWQATLNRMLCTNLNNFFPSESYFETSLVFQQMKKKNKRKTLNFAKFVSWYTNQLYSLVCTRKNQFLFISVCLATIRVERLVYFQLWKYSNEFIFKAHQMKGRTLENIIIYTNASSWNQMRQKSKWKWNHFKRIILFINLFIYGISSNFIFVQMYQLYNIHRCDV